MSNPVTIRATISNQLPVKATLAAKNVYKVVIQRTTISGGGSGGGSPDTFNEIPGGSMNGTNVTFTTLAEFVPEKLRVYLNGQRLTMTQDYFEAGGMSFTMVIPPTSSDRIVIDYTPS